jgi:D-glycero-D-manno-heptose 1,7-bisphosphate phosphatase
MRRPAAFLDRDGVIHEDRGYVIDPRDIHWMPGAIDAIRYLNEAGYYVFVVTNQSGIARGLYSEGDVVALFDFLRSEMAAQGARFDDYRYCPYHPEGTVARYRLESDWRKPAPGMLIDLMKHWPVDIAGSFLVGDRDSDIAAATAAGLPGHLYAGGDLLEFVRRITAAIARS